LTGHDRSLERWTVSGMQATLQRMTDDPGGATAIEYAMIAFFISIAGFSALVTIGGDVTSLFAQIAASF
jgi:Flp pilus assembly pilin Flp